jgi:hypothetical protein
MAHYNYIHVKQNWRLILFTLCYTISPNSETCQDDIISTLSMNVVFFSYTKTMLIYVIASEWNKIDVKF